MTLQHYNKQVNDQEEIKDEGSYNVDGLPIVSPEMKGQRITLVPLEKDINQDK